MTQLTREGLTAAVAAKLTTKDALVWPSGCETAASVATAITTNHLAQVLTGLRHDNRPVSFGKAFEVVYGERLTLERK